MQEHLPSMFQLNSIISHTDLVISFTHFIRSQKSVYSRPSITNHWPLICLEQVYHPLLYKQKEDALVAHNLFAAHPVNATQLFYSEVSSGKTILLKTIAIA